MKYFNKNFILGLLLGILLTAFFINLVISQEFSESGLNPGNSEAERFKYTEIKNELLDDRILISLLIVFISSASVITLAILSSSKK